MRAEHDGMIHSDFEMHYDLLPDPLLVHSRGVWIYANPAAVRLLGATSPADLVGRPTIEFVPADLRDAIAARIQKVASGARTEPHEQRLIRLDGQEIHVEVSGVPTVTPDGEAAVLITARDVSARHAMTQQFRATFEQSAVGMAHVAVNGRWLHVNDRLCHLLGYSRDELVEQTLADLSYAPDLPHVQAKIDDVLAGNVSSEATETRYVRKDGVLVWATLTISLVRKSDRTPDYFIAVVEDIGKRKAAEAALSGNEERFRHLVEHGSDLILVIGRDTMVKFASRNAVNVVGFSPAEIVGRSVFEFNHPED
ncbi:MAG TPA: PAS domain S-box protein, partial [Thermoanaerobaculia bacterium]